MTAKQKKRLVQILVGGAALIAALFLPLTGWWRFLAFLAAYLIAGSDVLLRAVRNILRGQIFDENFLMAIATLGAFCIREYPEGVAVMLFYQVGELFQSYAVSRSRQSIAALMDIRPDYANVRREGKLVKVDPEMVAIGDEIVVKAGEKIPLDGRVTEGESMLDTSALTGEAVPREAYVGQEVLSGCINLNGVLTVRVEREFGQSTVAKILDLVENASSKKAKAENFITKFARYYTPVVVIAAVLLATIPPLIVPGAVFSEWLERALIFLVVSCPCALVISVPLSFFGGIGGASKAGILIKGSNYLEALAKAKTVVMDKTGTLTKGTFEVTQVRPVGMEQERLLEIVAYAESYSDHPISLSLKRAYGKQIDSERVTEVEVISGMGVCARVDGRAVAAGNERLMKRVGALPGQVEEHSGTIVYAAVDGKYAGYILIADQLKKDAKMAISSLRQEGITKTVMLTGDGGASAKAVADSLGIDEVCAELLPADKVEQVERLLEQKEKKSTLVFIGDGINDAPVLSRADVGIAMGALGSDAAIEVADVVIMDDKPSKLSLAIRICRKTLGIVRQNIVFALAVKVVVMILGAIGIATMWEAVFADVGVSVIAILNAMRALRTRKK